MAIVKPFKGIRPPKNLVEKIEIRPYDVLDSEEARAEVDVPACDVSIPSGLGTCVSHGDMRFKIDHVELAFLNSKFKIFAGLAVLFY